VLNPILADDAAGPRDAVGPLERAVAAYPDYAPARSLLGFRLVFAGIWGIERDQGLLAGRQHAIRAIALDDRDPGDTSPATGP